MKTTIVIATSFILFLTLSVNAQTSVKSETKTVKKVTRTSVEADAKPNNIERSENEKIKAKTEKEEVEKNVQIIITEIKTEEKKLEEIKAQQNNSSTDVKVNEAIKNTENKIKEMTEKLIKENDRLKKFNVILANPPYSIKRWDRKMFESDPYGRNTLGTPPQGCADYAFQQHIIQSLDRENGRSVVLWPHGVLFRDQEKDMRKKLIEMDLVEAVIGLGPNLFYNSPMESCLLICRTNKKPNQRNKILFINAVNDVKAETGTSYLKDEHIEKVSNAFHNYEDVDGFAKVVKNEDIELQKHNLNISLYVSGRTNNNKESFDTDLLPLIQDWSKSSIKLKNSIKELIHE